MSASRNYCLLFMFATVLSMCLSSCSLISSTQIRKSSIPAKTENNASSAKEDNSRPASQADENALPGRCRQELTVLNTLDPATASPLSSNFSLLMHNMHQYAGFRNTLSEQLQETIDALYRYRVNKVCADIRHTLMNNLSQQVVRE